MLVKFVSSETGEVIMFAETAHQLLAAAGKECTARGVFTPEEMLPAAEALRQAVEQGGKAAPPADEEEGEETKEKPVALGPRAWPLIDMLERTAKRGKKGSIVWEAPANF